MLRLLRRLAVVAVLASTLVPSSGRAAPMAEVHPEHPGRHHAEYPNLVGIRLGFLSVFKREEHLEYIPGIIGGFSYERTLIHEWLEIEVSIPLAVLYGEDETLLAFPMDLHFKKPFHPAPRVSPYLAAGPAFDLLVSPEVKMFFGGSVAVGTYVWPTERIGVDVEVDYNIVAEGRTPVHELLFAVAPVFRF